MHPNKPQSGVAQLCLTVAACRPVITVSASPHPQKACVCHKPPSAGHIGAQPRALPPSPPKPPSRVAVTKACKFPSCLFASRCQGRPQAGSPGPRCAVVRSSAPLSAPVGMRPGPAHTAQTARGIRALGRLDLLESKGHMCMHHEPLYPSHEEKNMLVQHHSSCYFTGTGHFALCSTRLAVHSTTGLEPLIPRAPPHALPTGGALLAPCSPASR